MHTNNMENLEDRVGKNLTLDPADWRQMRELGTK